MPPEPFSQTCQASACLLPLLPLMNNSERRPSLPHPDVVAARKALAQRPPVPLESVLIQMKASEEWRHRQSDGKDAGPSQSS